MTEAKRHLMIANKCEIDLATDGAATNWHLKKKETITGETSIEERERNLNMLVCKTYYSRYYARDKHLSLTSGVELGANSSNNNGRHIISRMYLSVYF